MCYCHAYHRNQPVILAPHGHTCVSAAAGCMEPPHCGNLVLGALRFVCNPLPMLLPPGLLWLLLQQLTHCTQVLAPSIPVGWNCTNSRSCRGRPARATMAPPSPAYAQHARGNITNEPRADVWCTGQVSARTAPTKGQLRPHYADYTSLLLSHSRMLAPSTAEHCVVKHAQPPHCNDCNNKSHTHLCMCVRWLLRSRRARSRLWPALCCVR